MSALCEACFMRFLCVLLLHEDVTIDPFIDCCSHFGIDTYHLLGGANSNALKYDNT